MAAPFAVSQPIQSTYRGSPVTNSLDPSEGPKALSFSFDFSAATTYSVDLTTQQQAGRVGGIQTVYCDNSSNGDPVTITLGVSRQPIIVPAGAQTYVPILAPMPSSLLFMSSGAVTVFVALLNMPLPFAQWFPFDPHSNGSVTSGSGTDYSANAPALAAHLLLTMPVNLARVGYVVQNQSGEDVQVVLDDGAGGTATVLIASAAPVVGSAGGTVSYTGMPHRGRIRVFSATATDQVGAREW